MASFVVRFDFCPTVHQWFHAISTVISPRAQMSWNTPHISLASHFPAATVPMCLWQNRRLAVISARLDYVHVSKITLTGCDRLTCPNERIRKMLQGFAEKINSPVLVFLFFFRQPEPVTLYGSLFLINKWCCLWWLLNKEGPVFSCNLSAPESGTWHMSAYDKWCRVSVISPGMPLRCPRPWSQMLLLN